MINSYSPKKKYPHSHNKLHNSESKIIKDKDKDKGIFFNNASKYPFSRVDNNNLEKDLFIKKSTNDLDRIDKIDKITRKNTKKNKKYYKYEYKKRGGGNKTHKNKLGICSPKKKEKITGFSCYTYDDLNYLKRLWNSKQSPTSNLYINTNNPKQIYNLLYKYNVLEQLNNKNANKKCPITNAPESCILNEKYVNPNVINQIKKFAFAPEAPKEWDKNPNEWLSSDDIINVMNQYEKAYPCFKFIGPTPIDFDKKLGGINNGSQCVWNDLCRFSLSSLIKQGKNKIGIIFNTDPHNKPGQHWISLFINIKKGLIYFFDSVGDKAPKEIMILVDRIKKQGLNLIPSKKFIYDENHPVSHQKGETECGIYSLFFIIHMLEDKITSYYLKHHILKDKYIEKFRKIYFNM